MQEQKRRAQLSREQGEAPAEGSDMEGAVQTKGGDPAGAHVLDSGPFDYKNLAKRHLQMTEQEQNLYQHHLDNLRKGGVRMPQGGLASLQAITASIDGRSYILPTIWDNKKLPHDEAIKRAEESGLDKFPHYRNDREATTRYFKIHEFMDRDTQLHDIQNMLPVGGESGSRPRE